ncbi:Codeine O-demethylase [Spatholobus suberectus]|nr:Codeine O-demethylase [Spatholobus suberectus]
MEPTALVVPSVQEIVKEGLTRIPDRYVRPHHERPILSTSASLPQVPVIDLSKLLSQDLKGPELEKLHYACKEWGFFQIITNGIYRSIEHRVTINSEKARLSLATFYNPGLDAILRPVPSLVTPKTPALFKRISTPDYYKGYLSKELRGKSFLDAMKIQNENDVEKNS